MATKLEIFCNDGNILKRAVSYMKASWDNFTVVVKDLINQTSWQYDQYHDTLEIGKYVLFFIDQEGKTSNTKHEITITERSPSEIYVVFSYSKFLMMLDVKEKSAQEIDEMLSRKQLTRPNEYRGY